MNQTHLRSVDIGIGWGPNCGWQFRGDLNDARFDGHRDVLDTVRNRLRLKNGQDIPPGFYELVNRFLESHTYDEMSMTALDYVMKALESIGISSHSSDTWQIDHSEIGASVREDVKDNRLVDNVLLLATDLICQKVNGLFDLLEVGEFLIGYFFEFGPRLDQLRCMV